MEKKRTCGKLWRMLLPVMLLTMLLGMNAMAANKKVVNMTSQGKNLYVYMNQNADTATAYYHKIKVPATGILAVTGNAPNAAGMSSVKVILCNSKQQPLSARKYTKVDAQKNIAETYAVKKGTYYIKLSGHSRYIIGAQYTKWADNGGSSKSKAKSFKIGKTVKGLMLTGEKKSKEDWYKVKVSKKKQLQLDIQVASDGPFYFKLYGPSYPKGYSLGRLEDKAGVYKSITNGRKKLKVKTGTYYIRVYRSSTYSKANGAYTIKCSLK